MEWLNYHHLLYFSVAAREGTIARAGAELHLSQSAVSSQIRQLEDALGTKLFVRTGRRLALTDTGQVVLRYANEIFATGRELLDRVKSQDREPTLRMTVGIADVVPRAMARRLLAPLFAHGRSYRLEFRGDAVVEDFLAAQGAHGLDLVVADRPAASNSKMRTHSHLLTECATSFLAAPQLARRLRHGFPRSLHGAPLCWPGPQSTLRRDLDEWLEASRLVPQTVGEFEDSELAFACGERQDGVFVAPSVLEVELCRAHHVQVVGRTREVRARYYGSVLRVDTPHPGATAVLGHALAPVVD